MSSIEEAHQRYYDREMDARARRPLGERRERRLAEFVRACHREALSSVVEVGCGAGRDGAVLGSSGLAYAGLDLSSSSVRMCRELGLVALRGSALALPFGDDRFDAGWSMSTLMHLPGEGMTIALSELQRVVRTGGLVEVGVWGGEEEREWTDDHGRYFHSRTDEALQQVLSSVGEVVAFDTWGHVEDGWHYQWARVAVR